MTDIFWYSAGAGADLMWRSQSEQGTISFSLASADWIMALEPMWFSTMWGVYNFAGMTEAALCEIADEANARWPLQGLTIIHRHGPLAPGDRIVLVVAASPHRQAAFEAAEFLMDYLKTRAPFWKKEETPSGGRWVDARDADDAAAARWETQKGS